MLSPGAEPAQALAKLAELAGAEWWARLCAAGRRDLAAGVLSALLSAAEQLRGGVIMGATATNMRKIWDACILNPHRVVLILQVHRGAPPFASEHPISLEDFHGLVEALRQVDRQLKHGAGTSDGIAVAAALPADVAHWLALAAEEAKLSANPEERALWEGREPLEVAAELLALLVRAHQRAAG